MVKITIEIGNPISALGKKIATRKIEKINAKIEKLNNQKSKLESKFFKKDSKKVDSDKVTKSTEKIQKATQIRKVPQMGKTIFFEEEKFDFEKVQEILGVEIEKYQSIGMKKYGDVGIKATGNSDELAKAINKKKRSLKKYGLHLEEYEKSLNEGAVIN